MELSKVHRPSASRRLGEFALRCEASAAYATLCRHAFGLAVGQFSLLDGAQLDAVLRRLGPCRDKRLLDVGCGVGTVSEILAERTGADVTGVDMARRAIQRARRRCGHRGIDGQVQFHAADLSSLQLPSSSFDALVAIDSLYFLQDLDEVLPSLARVIAPGGQWLILVSDRVPAETEGRPRRGRLAGLLADLHLPFECEDFSSREVESWRRQVEILPQLEAAFRAEGNADLYDMLWEQARRCDAWASRGEIRRTLYDVRLPKGRSRT